MMATSKSRILLGILLIGISFVAMPSAQAQSETTGLLIPCDETIVDDQGNITIDPERRCTINHFFEQFLVLAQWGQSTVLILGVLFLVWGGIQWITAGGRASKIDEGKRIVLGTIVGIMISFTAYIIVNFTVAAITGTTAPAVNPFSGPIATIFGNSEEERPFSGSGGIENRTNCRASWDRFCGPNNFQIFCADPGTAPGKISDFQQLLNDHNCFCGQVDGCFGEQTATCVRRFQIANDLPPTGIIDQNTASILTSGGNLCTDASTHVNSVNNVLPAFSLERAAKYARGGEGCCMVKKDIGGVPTTVMCANTMTQRTCLSLGDNNVFLAGEDCLVNTTSKAECGFCHKEVNNVKSCFQNAGSYWCTNIVQPQAGVQVGFSTGSCIQNSLCENGTITSCKNTLYTDTSF